MTPDVARMEAELEVLYRQYEDQRQRWPESAPSVRRLVFRFKSLLGQYERACDQERLAA